MAEEQIEQPLGEQQLGEQQQEEQEQPVQQQQSVAEMKSEAIAHLTALRGEAVTEEAGKLIFSRYDSRNKGAWTFANVRLFLADLREAFGHARIVPNEAVRAVMDELQLNLGAVVESEDEDEDDDEDDVAAAEQGGAGQRRVEWVEFKSYVVYLQQTPLDQLDEVVGATVCGDDAVQEARVVVVRHLPGDVSRATLRDAFEVSGGVEAVFVVAPRRAKKASASGGLVPAAEALVVFDSAEAATRAVGMSGSQFEGVPMTVLPFQADSEFPTPGSSRQPSWVARGLGQFIVGAKQLDSKHRISARLATGAAAVASTVGEFAQKHQIKQKAARVGDQITEGAAKVDERFQISSKAAAVGQKMREVSVRVAQNPHVAAVNQKVHEVTDAVATNPHVVAGIGMVSGLISQVATAVTELTEDTANVVVQEQTRVEAVQAVEMESCAEDEEEEEEEEEEVEEVVGDQA